MEEVEQICSRIAIMDKGKSIAVGTKDELKRMIKNTETICINMPEPPEAVTNELKVLSHVYKVSYIGDELKIYCSGGRHNLIKVLEILQKHELYFGQVVSLLPTLNDVFLEITGKALLDSD